MMKFTGVVRRLDLLGRVVIPKEYRKMLKIKPGDPLEIIAMENGDILIRKVDISVELAVAGLPVVEEVNSILDLGVMLSDGEKYLAGAGSVKDRLVGTALSPKAKSLVENRKSYAGRAAEIGLKEAEYVLLHPISGETVFGAIVLFSDRPIEKSGSQVLQLAAKVLSNSMQRF